MDILSKESLADRFKYSGNKNVIKKFVDTITQWGEITKIINVQIYYGEFHITAKTTLHNKIYFISDMSDYYRWSPYGEDWCEHGLPTKISLEPHRCVPVYTKSTGRMGARKDKKFGKITDITISDIYKYDCHIKVTSEKKSEPISIQIQTYEECGYYDINTFDLCNWGDIINRYGSGRKVDGNCTDKECRKCDNPLTGQREQLRGVCRYCKINLNKNN